MSVLCITVCHVWCVMYSASWHTFYFDTSCKHRIEDGAMIIGGLVLVNIVLLNISGNKVKEQFWACLKIG